MNAGPALPRAYAFSNPMRTITLITTGGTIEKTYDEQSGQLLNRKSIVQRMVRRLRLEETAVNIIELMSKDSLFMTDDDRTRIVDQARQQWRRTRTMPERVGGIDFMN